jgi:hypothetical protein
VCACASHSLSLSSLSAALCASVCGGFAETKNNKGELGGLELGIRIPHSFRSELIFLEKIGDSCSKEGRN